MTRLISALALAALLSACSTQNAVFVTKTSLSVVDLDSAPASASIAFDRTEGYFGPRLDDGQVYPVTGYLRTTGSGLTRETQQVFAGGRAAVLVLGKTADKPAAANCSDGRSNPPLLFATGTTMGVKVGFLEGSVLPNAFTLGFRRKEATTVPVSKECKPSVLATFDSDSSARTAAGQPKLAGAIAQYFATGDAADALAEDPVVRGLFKAEAAKALGAVEAFNQREALQTRLALDVLACAGKVPDERFERVVNNAEDLALYDDPAAGNRIRAAATPAERRRLYAEELGLRLGDSDERSAALRFHLKRVCAIAQAA
jgi:hypothetical protein